LTGINRTDRLRAWSRDLLRLHEPMRHGEMRGEYPFPISIEERRGETHDGEASLK
jgi:hypothetical protein